MGPWLGSLVRRDGGDAVHLFPAGRRVRLHACGGRDHLTAGRAGDGKSGRWGGCPPRTGEQKSGIQALMRPSESASCLETKKNRSYSDLGCDKAIHKKGIKER